MSSYRYNPQVNRCSRSRFCDRVWRVCRGGMSSCSNAPLRGFSAGNGRKKAIVDCSLAAESENTTTSMSANSIATPSANVAAPPSRSVRETDGSVSGFGSDKSSLAQKSGVCQNLEIHCPSGALTATTEWMRHYTHSGTGAMRDWPEKNAARFSR